MMAKVVRSSGFCWVRLIKCRCVFTHAFYKTVLYIHIWKGMVQNKEYYFRAFMSSVQFSHSVGSNSLQPHGPQHARLPCPPSTPRACSNSCPLSQWCHPTISSSVILPSTFPSIRVFSNESVLCNRWPKYWSFSFSISPSNEYSWLPLGLTGLISFSPRDSRVFTNSTVQKHQFFNAQLTWLLKKPYPWLDGTCQQSKVSAF